MNIWGRSWLYRLYIIVGLPMTIAVTVFITLRSDPYEPEILPILAPVLVWVAGLLILQWTSLLTDGVGPDAPEGEEPLPGTADPPLDREALRTVLRLRAGHASSAPTPQSFAVKGFLFMTAFTIALPAGAVLYMTGVVEATISPLGAGGPAIPVAVLPGLALVALGVLRLAGQYRQAIKVADAYRTTWGCALPAFPHRSPVLTRRERLCVPRDVSPTRGSGTGGPFGSNRLREPRPFTSRIPCRRSRRASAS